MINGVLWRTRTGAPWRDVPSSYGHWKGIYSRHRRWSGDGTWELILDRLRAGCDGDDGSEWTVGVDSSVIRAHQHAAGARHEPPKDIPVERLAPMLPPTRNRRFPRRPRATQGAGSNCKNPAPLARVDREGLGRSRGGLSTKIHLLADTRCRPLARGTTAGQRHDSIAYEPLMQRLRIGRTGRGRPRTRPGRLLADKAYSNRAIRSYLRRRRIKATIPQKSDQQKARLTKGSVGGRPPAFDPEAYKQRNTTERTINRLKAFRAVAMRTDKREFVYNGTIDVASIKIWLRHPSNQDPQQAVELTTRPEVTRLRERGRDLAADSLRAARKKLPAPSRSADSNGKPDGVRVRRSWRRPAVTTSPAPAASPASADPCEGPAPRTPSTPGPGSDWSVSWIITVVEVGPDGGVRVASVRRVAHVPGVQLDHR